VFDPGTSPALYAGEVRTLHAEGLHVLAELLDSSSADAVPLRRFRRRVAQFVGRLRGVDEWEVGNEVNLQGPDAARKVMYAAAYAHRHSHRRTLLTMYWQLGEDQPQRAMFNWLAAHPRALADVDDVGISLYPQEAPMGFALDRVLRTLHAALPGKRILITELGYDIPDAPLGWTWGPPLDPAGLGRDSVAELYQSAILGYPFSGGGTFWWYYLEDALPRNSLWRTLAGIRLEALRHLA
jgi:hypothetical protein